MKYEKVETQKIVYDLGDIFNWIKTFASRQLGITAEEIKDSDINITPDLGNGITDITFSVSYTKNSSNNTTTVTTMDSPVKEENPIT